MKIGIKELPKKTQFDVFNELINYCVADANKTDDATSYRYETYSAITNIYNNAANGYITIRGVGESGSEAAQIPSTISDKIDGLHGKGVIDFDYSYSRQTTGFAGMDCVIPEKYEITAVDYDLLKKMAPSKKLVKTAMLVTPVINEPIAVSAKVKDDDTPQEFICSISCEKVQDPVKTIL